jgi:hypothetical protein
MKDISSFHKLRECLFSLPQLQWLIVFDVVSTPCCGSAQRMEVVEEQNCQTLYDCPGSPIKVNITSLCIDETQEKLF